jgi:NAD(P)-dependent dehydrogenase (short-subunit alcohol dehydrogenase family)
VSDFKGKVALVTGASRGIGASEVRLLAALAKDLSASGATVAYVHLDATITADWARAVERAVEMFGQLDILINNAGVHGRLGLEETSEEEWIVCSTMISKRRGWA